MRRLLSGACFHIQYILLLSSALLLSGCEPEIIINKIPKYKECDEEPAPLYQPGATIYGSVSGLKNCLPFLASAKAYLAEDATHVVALEITTYTESNHQFTPKEFIGIGASSPDLGTWTLMTDSIPELAFQQYSIVTDQGILEEIFRLDTNYEYNRMTITSIDTTARRVQGRFECRFILSSSLPGGVHPDTVLFLDCHFDVVDPE